jgi:hypothetical protein
MRSVGPYRNDAALHAPSGDHEPRFAAARPAEVGAIFRLAVTAHGGLHTSGDRDARRDFAIAIALAAPRLSLWTLYEPLRPSDVDIPPPGKQGNTYF